jgi:predicted NAD/FAD-dependent oxidoreductase
MKQSTIAIVGAGIAGLSCAVRLAAAGREVCLFDKGRGPGGRMATRRIELPDGRQVSFDHGAQYFTARDQAFAAVCDRLARQGAAVAFPWPVFSRSRAGANAHLAGDRWTGAGGMNAVPKALARGLEVSSSRQVGAIARSSAGWRLTFVDGRIEEGFDKVVIATPAEQAAPLLRDIAPQMAEEARAAHTGPCWAGLFAFESAGGSPLGALRFDDDEVLAWLARTDDGQGWVAHASIPWTRLNLELEPDAVARELEAAVRRVLGGLGESVAGQVHRWRYAQVEVPIGSPYAWDPDLGLGVCGDWRLGPRVELAWRSGDALGTAMAAVA